jgi:hypothetical protein
VRLLSLGLTLAVMCQDRVGCDCGGGTESSRCPELQLADAGTPDAGDGDAGGVDAGSADAGDSDAGTADAGSPDAGVADAGPDDAGTVDAGRSDAGTPDAGPATLLVSATPISDATGFTYVELDVDWGRRLAYLGSRRTGVCVDVVDFSNPRAPALVHTLGTAGLYGCLGVKLFENDTLLAVSANGTNNLEVWNLTANPRDFAAWTLLADAPLGNQGKRFAAIEPKDAGLWDLTLATRFSVRTLAFALDAGLSQTAINIPAAGEYNDCAVLGGSLVSQSYLGNTEPILRFDRANALALQGSTPTAYWAWTLATNGTRQKVFVGGAPGFAVLSLDQLGALVKREFSFGSVNTTSIRSSTIVAQGGSELVYAVYSDCQVDVFNIDDPLNPVLVQSGRMPVGSFVSECYAIRVEPATDTGLIVSNHGTFIVFRPSLLPVATAQYPPVP